jgi:UDP-N-acetylmuramate dehydrogenase
MKIKANIQQRRARVSDPARNVSNIGSSASWRTRPATIQKNILLKDFTTFSTGGPARYFVRVKTLEELKYAVKFSRRLNLRYFVLGRGANVLVSDVGFNGLVIKMEICGTRFEKKKNGAVCVTAGAGEDWDAFVAKTLKRGFVGLENLSLVPGTVGASAVGSIGCYGTEVKDHIFSVEALNTETMRIKKFSNKECNFKYRESFFKTKKGKNYIVTSVTFELKKNGTLKMDYKDVQEYFLRKKIISPKAQDLRDAIIEIRTKKLPNILTDHTAGSFFKNIVLPDALADEIIKKYPGIAVYPAGRGKKKLATGWILDHICGLRGVWRGNIGTHINQALCVVNNGQGTTEEVLEFAKWLQEQVKNKLGVFPEFEVQVIK